MDEGVQSARLNALTGLRFFAAMAIVVHHMQGILIPRGTFDAVNLGNGVSFFFCLSGFILHYNYRSRISTIPAYKFLWWRYMRLWPAHVAALLLVLFFVPNVVAFMERTNSPAEIARVVFLLHSLEPNRLVYYAWNSPSWSIATEMVFYSIFPVLCIAARTRPFVTWAAVLIAVLAYLVFAQTLMFDPDIKGNAHGLGAISPVPRLVEFASGIVVCEIFVYRHKIALRHAALTEIAAVLAVAVLMVATRNGFLAVRGDLPPVVASFLGATIMFPAFCVAILVFSVGTGPVSRILAARPIVWLGEVSFAVYLVHFPVLRFIRKYLTESGMADWQLFGLFLFLTITISALIFEFIEKPAIRWSRSLGRNPERAADFNPA